MFPCSFPRHPVIFSDDDWGFIAGLIKGNQWLISPKHKALFFFLGGGTSGGASHYNIAELEKVHVNCRENGVMGI